MLKIFCSEFEVQSEDLQKLLESSEWPFKNALIEGLAFLEKDNDEVRDEVLQHRSRYIEHDVCWQKLELKWTCVPMMNSALGLKQFFKDALFAAGLFQRWGREIWGADPVMAVESFLHANRILNECRGSVNFNQLIDDEKIISEGRRQSAKKGGKAKAEHYIPVKKEVIRLLLKNVPSDGGWQKRIVAARAIEQELMKFVKEMKHQNSGLDLNVDELIQTVVRWGREDSEVRAAYEATVRVKVGKKLA
ncbi:hypothetical protein IW01_04525 [Pectobacterium brasiliense]|uniref:hypothetical protein n=1 Tax=Enterobacterales TaxID=91347 RepID=UPI0004E78FE5|nr:MULTISPECIES: hypothetical protein [Enterobacterales]KFF72338.1 hypothetical protein IW01_04525 [Pectobacterium brasiliense]HBX2471546.1 hypothetical protein [Klebsiella pneumoniae]